MHGTARVAVLVAACYFYDCSAGGVSHTASSSVTGTASPSQTASASPSSTGTVTSTSTMTSTITSTSSPSASVTVPGPGQFPENYGFSIGAYSWIDFMAVNVTFELACSVPVAAALRRDVACLAGVSVNRTLIAACVNSDPTQYFQQLFHYDDPINAPIPPPYNCSIIEAALALRSAQPAGAQPQSGLRILSPDYTRSRRLFDYVAFPGEQNTIITLGVASEDANNATAVLQYLANVTAGAPSADLVPTFIDSVSNETYISKDLLLTSGLLSGSIGTVESPKPTPTGHMTSTSTPSGTQSSTASPSSTATGSISASVVSTPTASPSSSLLFRSWSSSIVVLRVGDATWPTSTSPGTALPGFLEYYDVALSGVSNSPWLTVPLATQRQGSSPACTLGAGVRNWNYDTEGWLSTSGDGTLVVLPCYNVAAGQLLDSGADAKTIATVDASAKVSSFGFTAWSGSRKQVTGIRQVATVDGTDFWLSGAGPIKSTTSGFRYVAAGAPTTTAIMGDDRENPGKRDARGIAISNGRLYGSDSGEHDMGWGGVFSMGLLQTSENERTESARLLTGTKGTSNPWTFAFATDSIVWVSESPSSTTKGTIVCYRRSGPDSSWIAKERVLLERYQPVYSIAVRKEGKHSAVYAASRTTVYRYAVHSRSHSIVASAPEGTAFRGVAIPARY